MVDLNPVYKKKVLHYVSHPKFYRCFLTFKDDDQYEHYYLIAASHIRFLKVPKTRVICQARALHLSCGQSLKKINELNPDVITFCNWNLNGKVINELKGFRKHVFNHGVMCPGLLQLNYVQNSLKKFDRYFVNRLEAKYLIRNKISEKKIEIINGYIGIDFLATLDLENSRRSLYKKYKWKSEDVKTILFVTNKAGFGGTKYINHSLTEKDYSNIIKNLSNFADENNYYIYSKMKPTGTLENSINKKIQTKKRVSKGNLVYDKKLRKFVPSKTEESLPEPIKIPKINRIRLINSGELISGYFSADLIVIQGYSTSYLEALYLDKPVVILNMTEKGKADYQGIDQLKYKYLPLIKSQEEIIPELEKLQKDNFAYLKDPRYQLARKQYLKEHLGDPIEMISSKVYNLDYLSSKEPKINDEDYEDKED